MSSVFPRLMCIVLAGALAAPASAAEAEKIDLIYPRAETLFWPHVYGKPDAPNAVAMIVSPGFTMDSAFFTTLYPKLLPLINEGRVKLELGLIVHDQIGAPIYLATQCVAPTYIPNYLYAVFSKGNFFLSKGDTDIEEQLTNLALSAPEYIPAGLSEDQFQRRMRWCFDHRREGIRYSEAYRFGAMDKWKLEKGAGILFPAAIVNGVVFSMDAFGQIPADAVMGALK